MASTITKAESNAIIKLILEASAPKVPSERMLRRAARAERKEAKAVEAAVAQYLAARAARKAEKRAERKALKSAAKIVVALTATAETVTEQSIPKKDTSLEDTLNQMRFDDSHGIYHNPGFFSNSLITRRNGGVEHQFADSIGGCSSNYR
jgi:hypothetical protein